MPAFVRFVFSWAILTVVAAPLAAQPAPPMIARAQPSKIALVNLSTESKGELQLTFELDPLVSHYEVAFPSAAALIEALKKVQKPKGSEVTQWQDGTVAKMLITMPNPPSPMPGPDDKKLSFSYSVDRWDIRYTLKAADPRDVDSYVLSATAMVKNQSGFDWDQKLLELVWDGAKFEHVKGAAPIAAGMNHKFDLAAINKISFDHYRPIVVSGPYVTIPTPAVAPAAQWAMTFKVNARLALPVGKLQFVPLLATEPSHNPPEINWPTSLAAAVNDYVEHRLAIAESRVVITTLQPRPTKIRSFQIQCNRLSLTQTQYVSLRVINNTGLPIQLVAGTPVSLAEAPGNMITVDIPTTTDQKEDLFTADVNLLRQLCSIDCSILTDVLKLRGAIDDSLAAIKRLQDEVVDLEAALREQQSPPLVPAIAHDLENKIYSKRKEIGREQVKLAKARFALRMFLSCEKVAASP